ncbi:MAG: hypothetical protein IJJ85_00410 [Clostridia bacterium]|nr:hypothetical protein [Clostridia bacterium]
MKKSFSLIFALFLLCAFLTPVYADLVWTDENGVEHYDSAEDYYDYYAETETEYEPDADEAAVSVEPATKTNIEESIRRHNLLTIALVVCVMLVTGVIIIVLSRKNKRAKAAGSAPATVSIPDGTEAPTGQDSSFPDPTKE